MPYSQGDDHAIPRLHFYNGKMFTDMQSRSQKSESDLPKIQTKTISKGIWKPTYTLLRYIVSLHQVFSYPTPLKPEVLTAAQYLILKQQYANIFS